MKATIPAQVYLTNAVAWKAADEGQGEGSEKGPRRFRMAAYTGGIFDVGFGPAVIDLEGLQAPAAMPALRQHDPKLFVGRCDEIEKSPTALDVGGYLFDGVANSDEVALISAQDGAWQASVGIGINFGAIEFVDEDESISVNGQTLQGPFIRLKETVLKESSFVPLGADPNTSAAVLAATPTQTVNLGHKEATMPKAHETDPLQAEQERQKAIRKRFDGDKDFALEAITEGWSLAEARAEYGDRLETKLADERKEREREREQHQAELEAAAKTASKSSPASKLGGSSGDGGPDASLEGDDDPIASWNKAVAKRVASLESQDARPKTHGLAMPRHAALKQQAVLELASENPDLRAAFVEAYNERGLARTRSK